MCDANSVVEQYIQQGSQGAVKTSSFTRGDLFQGPNQVIYRSASSS